MSNDMIIYGGVHLVDLAGYQRLHLLIPWLAELHQADVRRLQPLIFFKDNMPFAVQPMKRPVCCS